MENTDALLIVDDDVGLQRQLKWVFDDLDVKTASDRETALAAVRRFEPAAVLLDLGLPPDAANATEGMAALKEILEVAPSTKVIVITGNDDREHALRAIAKGAYDYYQKPADPDVLKIMVDRALHVAAIERENRRLQSAQGESPLEGIVATSPEMLQACRMVERVAASDATVLILGESGTGKELIARALHGLSPRADERFVAINCAAIPETLLESELFGYEKGAFTGAAKRTPGKIEVADGGTLFLDEIGDMPLALQAKLLRFLQERVVERVGGREEIPVDVRIVCATHQDLEAMLGEQTFREDLYYRLSEIAIEIPALRERTGDAVVLARLFLRRFAEAGNPRVRGFTDEALQVIDGYEWPGNVRELENKIKRAVIMSDGPLVDADLLGLTGGNGEHKGNGQSLNLRQVREAAEHEALVRALSQTDKNIAKAATLLGVSRPTLYDLMNKHGLK
jgi:two-component system NtrC family response regulator